MTRFASFCLHLLKQLLLIIPHQTYKLRKSHAVVHQLLTDGSGNTQLSFHACRYIKTGTHPHRFFHLKPAVTPATDTDIGPLLSAPHSRTGSWPQHKFECLMGGKKKKTHNNSCMCHKGAYSALSHTFTPPPLTSLHMLFILQPICRSQANSPAFSDISKLDPEAPARGQHTHHRYWIPLLRTCFVLTPSARAVLLLPL